jgi:hypothetical protein
MLRIALQSRFASHLRFDRFNEFDPGSTSGDHGSAGPVRRSIRSTSRAHSSPYPRILLFFSDLRYHFNQQNFNRGAKPLQDRVSQSVPVDYRI